MKYVREVTEYCFKNFWFVMLFTIVPVVFVGLLLHPFQFVEFLFNYPSSEFNGFGDFFYGIIPFNVLTIFMGILGILLCAVLLSLFLGRVENHFRTGKRNFEFNLSDFNNNFLSMLWAMFMLFFSIFFIDFLGSVFIMLFHFILAKNGLLLLSTIFVYLIGLLCTLTIVFLSLVFGIAAVDRMIMGSPFLVAIGAAFSAIKKKPWEIFFTAFLPFALGIVLSFVGAFLGIMWLTNILSLVVIIPFLSVLVMIVFFKHYEISRYDTRPYYSLK